MLKCDECPAIVNKLTQVDAGSMSRGIRSFWLCDQCLEYNLISENDGTFCFKTGQVRIAEHESGNLQSGAGVKK